MADGIEALKEWVETMREDIEALKALLASEGADEDAREYAAAGLNYLVTRMDLVPDHQEAVGIIDDVMVIRVVADLASQYGLGSDLGAGEVAALGRLVNEVDAIEPILGAELYAKLRTYCSRLKETAVRDRTPEQIAGSAELREQLFGEIEDDLLRLPPAPFDDPDLLVARLKSHLHHKLADL